jgi:hypothetical protein
LAVDQARNVAAISDRRVIREGHPILLVVHYADDESWAFLSGGELSVADGLVVGMGEVVRGDRSLLSIADLPPGWTARRERVGGIWTREEDPDV